MGTGDERLEFVVFKEGEWAPESSLSNPSIARPSFPWILRCFLREEGWV